MTTPSEIIREADRLRARAADVTKFRKALSSTAPDVYVKVNNDIQARFPSPDVTTLGKALEKIADDLVKTATALEARVCLVNEDPSE